MGLRMTTTRASATFGEAQETPGQGGPGARRGARLGISVPHEWWPSAPLLKSYEAAGFAWVQLHSPPESVLADPRACRQHAHALATSLSTTGLRAVIHAPGGLRLGSRAGNRAFEGLLAYAAEIGAEQIVYHGLAFPADDPAAREPRDRELRSLIVLAGLAERLGVKIAIENLAPLYPGPETASASPREVRGLVKRIGSPWVAVCLDLGHAHIVADGRHTSVEKLGRPVLDTVSVFHVHDNFGARRRRAGDELGVDPLRLDLHLAPGRGTVPWHRLEPALFSHAAPVILEVHPPFRARSADLARSGARVLGERPPAG